jgi:hypothetical protein
MNDVTATVKFEGGQWVVLKCPHCGKKHYHGAGPRGGDPREYLGHRSSHCAKGGYVMEEAASTMPTIPPGTASR